MIKTGQTSWLRWTPIWSRNMRVWRKLIGPALLGNIGEPLLYLLALGYGLGSFLGQKIEGLEYVVFLASGMVCASAMNTASFEGMYSAYTRMAVQDTWLGMLTAPLTIRDIIVAEVIWCGTKSTISVLAILLVASLMGLVADARALLVLPLGWFAGACFGAMALVMTAVAKNYDFFLYYFTLLVTPMLLLSGVFFPIDNMPEVVQTGAKALPLYHALALMRPLMIGQWPTEVLLHLGVLLLYILIAIPIAIRLISRRLLR
ncbi:MAG: ABC transporter permease [Thioalkalispiraceae bacterium]|jgi:lipooligosaccharide transport system permease protein